VLKQAKEKGATYHSEVENAQKKSCEGSSFGEVKLFAMSHGLN